MPMRLFRPVALLSLCLGLSSVAAADTKIGYFDVRKILSEVEDAKAAKSRLETEVKDKQKQLDQRKADVERIQKDLEARKAVLSPQAREQMESELQNKAMAAQKLFVDLQGELAQREQALLADLLGRLEPVVGEIARTEGYSFVFERSESGLFYGQEQHDLTSQVIRKYNARFPAKGGAAKAPPAPKK